MSVDPLCCFCACHIVCMLTLMRSAVLNVLFVRELTKRLPQKTRLIVDAVNPGFCKSNLRSNLPTWLKILFGLQELFLGRTTEEGSRRLVLGALGYQDREDELHGAYVSECELQEVSDYALSPEGEEVQKRIWVKH